MDGKPIMNHKTNSKVRISKIFTNKSNSVGCFKGDNDIHSTNTQSLSPVVDSNRFWPLIDVMNDQEGKVVVHESKCEKQMHKGKVSKLDLVQSSNHTDTKVNSILHSDTVGDDGARLHTDVVTYSGGVVHCTSVPTCLHDKYDLSLRFKSKHKHRTDKAANLQIFQQWDNQTTGKFGHIPLASQLLAKDDKSTHHKSDLLQIHKEVKRTGNHNFLDARSTMSVKRRGLGSESRKLLGQAVSPTN